jgi:hypothetical protein
VVVDRFGKNGGTFYKDKERRRPPMVYLRSTEQLRIYQGGGQMDYSRMARKLREKIAGFSGELSQGLPKVAERFVREMVYGIQASQSVVLTKIGRMLEEPVSIKKVEERLSRQLLRRGMGHKVQQNLLVMASKLVGEDTLLILDLSDIRKKYAKKMQYLGTVRDGSEGELGNGYWTCNVIATEVDGNRIVPLVGRLYSAEAPEFVSENREILTVVDMVAGSTNKRGLWVIDRGGDRRNLIVPMLKGQRRFLIRMIGNRNLLWAGKEMLASEIAKDCPLLYAETIVKVDDGKEKVYHLEFGYRNVKFPGRGETLGLLVVHGFGQEPMMLLTTEPLRRSRKALWRLVRAYIRRWAIEETIRYIKQSYELEDVRVLNYRSLQNMMPLVYAVAYFAAVLLDTASKLRVMAGYVLKAAKRVFGIPEFHYYCIADGLTSIFTRYPGRIVRLRSKLEMQGMLFFSSA